MSQLEFEKMFEVKHRGTNMTCIKAQKLLTLTQTIDFVKEYSNKFDHLARYTFQIAYTKIEQMKKFVYGLNPTIVQDAMIGT